MNSKIQNEPISAHFMQVLGKDGLAEHFSAPTYRTITSSDIGGIITSLDGEELSLKKARHLIKRLKDKRDMHREKSIAANEQVKTLAKELYYAKIQRDNAVRSKEHYRKEAESFRKKYCDLIKDISIIKEEDANS